MEAVAGGQSEAGDGPRRAQTGRRSANQASARGDEFAGGRRMRETQCIRDDCPLSATLLAGLGFLQPAACGISREEGEIHGWHLELREMWWTVCCHRLELMRTALLEKLRYAM